MTTSEARAMTTTDQSTAVVVPRSMANAVPKQMVVKLKYYSNLTLDAVAGGAAVNVFSANSGYDPDITGAGGQPRGLDQYFAFYAKAICTSSKITVKGSQTVDTNAGIGSALLGVCLMNKTATETNPKPYIEDPRCSWIQIAGLNSTDQEARLTYGAKSFFDYKDPIDESDMHFTNAVNASQQAYYHVFAGAITASANPGAVYVQAVIEYTFTFFEPVALASS